MNDTPPTDTNPLVFVDTFLIESMAAALGHVARHYASAEGVASALLECAGNARRDISEPVEQARARRQLQCLRIPKKLVDDFFRLIHMHPYERDWAWLIVAVSQQTEKR